MNALFLQMMQPIHTIVLYAFYNKPVVRISLLTRKERGMVGLEGLPVSWPLTQINVGLSTQIPHIINVYSLKTA